MVVRRVHAFYGWLELMRMTDHVADVVLSSNTPISGPSPTWSFAGFIPLQSLENFLNQQGLICVG